MKSHKIGNWEINNEGIIWNGATGKYVVDKNTLFDRRPGSPSLFDWHLHLAGKTWIESSDLNDFNNAFLYAVNAYGMKLPIDMSIDETLKEQKLVFKLNN